MSIYFHIKIIIQFVLGERVYGMCEFELFVCAFRLDAGLAAEQKVSMSLLLNSFAVIIFWDFSLS